MNWRKSESKIFLETLYLTTTRIGPAYSHQPTIVAMANKRKVEIFSAGCPVCEDTVSLVRDMACSSCEVEVLDMSDPEVSRHAENLGIQALPAVVVDGSLAECCTGRGVSREALRAEGVGEPTT